MRKIGSFLLSLIIFWGLASHIQTTIYASEPLIDNNNIEASQESQLEQLNNQSTVVVHMFARKTCGHCKAEKEFLSQLLNRDDHLEVRLYYTEYPINSKIINLVADRLEAQSQYVPFTVIGDQYLVGFGTADTTGVELVNVIENQRKNPTSDIVEEVLAANKITSYHEIVEAAAVEKNNSQQEQSLNSEIINLPIFGKINPKTLSLPILTILISLADGFNPCAMWTLLFLISLLIGLEDRKRMWILGLTFIFASGFVYFLFMAAWLNFFLFIGFVLWVRLIIGILAVYIAYTHLKDFIKNKDGACKVDLGGRKQRVFAKLKEITYKKHLIFALTGIILIAFAVNLVELVCSAGLPAVYTNLLSMTNLSKWQYYGYLILYIFFFMLDDIGVFAVAMFTFKRVGLETKYARYSSLIGGILMGILGILLIFKPEWLMFS